MAKKSAKVAAKPAKSRADNFGTKKAAPFAKGSKASKPVKK